jgi:hypothetical protein
MWLYPLTAIVLYLGLSRFVPVLSTLVSETLSIVHNTALVAFSAWAFCEGASISVTHLHVPSSGMLVALPRFVRLISCFYVSKYYELGDTMLLYAKGKTPSTLQVVHHVGALIFWHIMYTHQLDVGLIPTVMNAFVHTIMYSYFLLSRYINLRAFRLLITRLQITQLVVFMKLHVMFGIDLVC